MCFAGENETGPFIQAKKKLHVFIFTRGSFLVISLLFSSLLTWVLIKSLKYFTD